MTSAAFTELCKTQLSAEDSAAFDALLGGAACGGALACGAPFVSAWRAWERALSLNLARYRAQKLKRDAAGLDEPPANPADAASAAKAAAAMESPLEAELFLDQARWNAIDSMQGLSYFGENVVFAYLLKLRILERDALFKADEGFAEYKALYATILENTGK
jgi:hypothetical protein